jgi:hypothetical protein
MNQTGIPLIVITCFWFIVGGICPFFAKGPNKELAFLNFFLNYLKILVKYHNSFHNFLIVFINNKGLSEFVWY